ncbi:MAG: hypothetical protein DRO11_05060 [Methanobacteriota archaeon]|nr:MAG: hypothetical protein DRO11_05060 [Euryarchaeota archaeon]
MKTGAEAFFLVFILLAATITTPNMVKANKNQEKTMKGEEKIVGALQSIIEKTEEDQPIRIIVELREDGEEVYKAEKAEMLAKLIEKRRNIQRKIVGEFETKNIVVQEKHWVVNALTLEATPRQIEEIIAPNPRVEKIWPDLKGEIQTLGEKSSQGNHASEVQADILRKLVNLDGTGIKIGFIDSGIDNQTIQVEKEKDFTNEKNNLPSGDHGTHVAGIVAGNTTQEVEGVAPGVTIYDAKVQDQAGDIYMSWVIKAIEWLLDPDGEPSTDDGVDIINSSVAFFPYATWCECQTPGCTPKECDSWPDYPLAGLTPLSKAIENAAEQGVVFVGATGNRGPGNSSLAILPPNAVRVAAPELDPEKGFYSSIGPTPQGDVGVDLIAPGKNVLSTTPTGTKKKTGTSQSAPYIAGVAALLLQREKLRPDQVKTRLMNGAIPYNNLLAYQQGAGVVNALTAVYPQLTANRGMLNYGIVKPGEEKTVRTEVENHNKHADLVLRPRRSRLVNTAFSDWWHQAIYVEEKEFGPIEIEAGETIELDEEIVKIKAENKELGRSLAPGTYIGVLTLSLEEPIEIPVADFTDGEYNLEEAGLGIDLNDDGDKNDSWLLSYNSDGNKLTVKSQGQELVTADPGKNIYFQDLENQESFRVFTYTYEDDKLVFDVQLSLPISFVVPAVPGADNPLVYTTEEEIIPSSTYLTGKSDNFDHCTCLTSNNNCFCQPHYGDYTYFTLLVPPESKALELRQETLKADGCQNLAVNTKNHFDAYLFDQQGNLLHHTEAMESFRINNPEPGVYTVVVNSDNPPQAGESCFQYHFHILENKLVEVEPNTWEETVVADPISKTWKLTNQSGETLEKVAVMSRTLQPIETRTYTGVVYPDDAFARVYLANAFRDQPGHHKKTGSFEYTYHRKYPIPSNIVMLELELGYTGPGDLDIEAYVWYDANHNAMMDDGEYFFVDESTHLRNAERLRVLLDNWRHLTPTIGLGHWDEPTDIVVDVVNAGIDQDTEFELKAVLYGYVPWNQLETQQGALSWSVTDREGSPLETLFPGYNLVGWKTFEQGETKEFTTTLTGVSALKPGEEHHGVIWILETREIALSVTARTYDQRVGKYMLQESFDEDGDDKPNEDPADLGPDCDYENDPYCCTKYPNSCATVQEAATNNNLDNIDNDWNGCIALQE